MFCFLGDQIGDTMAYYRIGRDAIGRPKLLSSFEAPDERGSNVISISRLRGRLSALDAIADDQPRKRTRRVGRAPVVPFPSPAGEGPGPGAA